MSLPPRSTGPYSLPVGNNRRAETVHDDLFARALAVQTDQTTLVLVSLDLIGFFAHDIEDVKKSLVDSEAFKIHAPEIIVASVHPHQPEKVNVYLAADIRRTLREAGYQTPVAAAGRIPNARVAESVLENREADLVAIARPTLCDPQWPKKTAEGREEEILRCVYCNKCKEADEAFQKVYCAQWGKERRG